MTRIIWWGAMAIVYSFIPEEEITNKTLLICLCILMAFDRLFKKST
ncbi:hypothetical protein KAR91_36215 [Candidatus Pacearchaeota archaeon]|nr:hypothetical protein [Candidatus Pacearchaeota archaeon]